MATPLDPQEAIAAVEAVRAAKALWDEARKAAAGLETAQWTLDKAANDARNVYLDAQDRLVMLATGEPSDVPTRGRA